MAEKNDKIQNSINERTRKATKCYHLSKILLRNKDIDRKCKVTIYKPNLYVGGGIRNTYVMGELTMEENTGPH
jgi:hypothetical protein